MTQQVEFLPSFIENFPIAIRVDNEIETSWKRKLAIHTFPYSNIKEIDDQSYNEDELSIDFVLDPDFVKEGSLETHVKRLESLLKKRSLVSLVHPVYGRIQIRVVSFSSKYTVSERHVDFSMSFEIESGLEVLEEADILSSDNRLQDIVSALPDVNSELILEQVSVLKDSSNKGLSKLQQFQTKAATAFDKFKRAKDVAVLKTRAAVEGFTVRYDRLQQKLLPFKEGKDILNELREEGGDALLHTFGRINNDIRGILASRNALIARTLTVKSSIKNSLNTFLDIFNPEDKDDIINSNSSIISYLTFNEATRELIEGSKGSSGSDIVKITDAVNSDIRNIILELENYTASREGQPVSVATSAMEAEIIRANKALEFTVFSNQIATLINELLNEQSTTEQNNVFNRESFDSINSSLDLLASYYSNYINEKSKMALDELKNAFANYQKDSSPFLYKTKKETVSDLLISDVLYETNGNLDLLEATWELNNVTSSAAYSGELSIYQQE